MIMAKLLSIIPAGRRAAAAGLLIVHLLIIPIAGIAHDIYPFDNAQQQAQFNKLSHELRCLVCQSESIAESNAPFASDIRQIIYEQVRNSKTNPEIINSLTEQYGDYIHLKPDLHKANFLIWLAPLLTLLLGSSGLVVIIVRQRAKPC
ncbi:MAG: cytochrome C biogenesis protein [Legionellales bacterium]|nr:cytochrome C biogenesis protein [Legionellales bacterium]|tara:strand:- start:10851 stop:11294 length:444 start_codon:yes stop_codon:yes gene_type:complete